MPRPSAALTDGRRPVMLLSFLSAPVAVMALGLARDIPVIALDAATTLAFGVIVLFAFRETRPRQAALPAASAEGGLRRRLSQLTRAPILLVFSFLALVFGIIYTQGNVTLPLDMASHGLLPAHYGTAISVNGVLIILITIPVSAMAARWPRFPTIASAGLILGIGFGFTALASTLPMFMLSVAIWTVEETLASAIAPTVVADLSPVETRGLFQGILGAAWGLSYFAGPCWRARTFLWASRRARRARADPDGSVAHLRQR